MKKFNAKRIATLGILTSLALITFIIEGLFPPLFIPGAKMGLSNIFTLLCIILLSPVDGVILIILRTVLGSLITGSVSSLMFSLSAGLISIIITILMYQFAYPKVSVLAISVLSACVHNLTQNAVYCLVTSTPALFAYSPYLTLIGILSGVIVGFATSLIIKALPKKLIDELQR